MQELKFIIQQEDVYNEVAKTTSYAGVKSDDEHLYDKLATIDEDAEMLERFWDETISALESTLQRFIDTRSLVDGEYNLHLKISLAFNTNLKDGMQKSLFSYFTSSIISKWYKFMDKEEATLYATEAVAHLDSFKNALLKRNRPNRPTI